MCILTHAHVPTHTHDRWHITPLSPPQKHNTCPSAAAAAAGAGSSSASVSVSVSLGVSGNSSGSSSSGSGSESGTESADEQGRRLLAMCHTTNTHIHVHIQWIGGLCSSPPAPPCLLLLLFYSGWPLVCRPRLALGDKTVYGGISAVMRNGGLPSTSFLVYT